MKPKFCPACGKETNELFNGLCEDCRRNKSRLASIPEKIKISVCKNCGKIEGAEKLHPEKEAFEKIIKKNIEKNGEIEKIEIEKTNKSMTKAKLVVKVQGKLKSGLKKEETFETTIEIKERLCETCGKINGGYYEGIIQLRSEKTEKMQKTLKNLIFMIEKRGHVTKILETKNGIDIYMTPKKMMGQIIGEIKDKKEIKKSYTLVTKKDGKDLYRNTVLVRL